MQIRHLVVPLAVLLLAACSAPAPPTPAPTESEVAEPADMAPAEPGEPLPEFFSTCEDPTGDGDGLGDLVSVGLSNDGSLVFVTFTFAEPVQPSDFGRISLLTNAYPSSGEGGYQFGSQFSGGQEIANFVFDNAPASQENIANGAVFADGQASMRYPVAEVAGLGAEFSWFSVIAVDGTDVDFCGGPLEDAITVP